MRVAALTRDAVVIVWSRGEMSDTPKEYSCSSMTRKSSLWVETHNTPRILSTAEYDHNARELLTSAHLSISILLAEEDT